MNVLTAGAQLRGPKVRVVRVVRAGSAGFTTASTGTRGIAFTGADIAQMVLIGGVLIAVGTALTRGARRRPSLSGADVA